VKTSVFLQKPRDMSSEKLQLLLDGCPVDLEDGTLRTDGYLAEVDPAQLPLLRVWAGSSSLAVYDSEGE
jgi:hypothetical protein